MRFNPLEHPICWSTPDRLAPTSWADCLPFGMVVVDLVRPATLVELGTFTGVSYCGFCQAVKTLGIDTRCVAIDTWEGDPHSGQYGPDILDDLRRYHDPLYGEFSRLIPATFDKACDEFPDGTIDLLHIDGFHRYEAVKHDVERWLPKMSARGVVLLHDIMVRDKDFGVWRVWQELRQQHPCIGLTHGKGLGLLAVGSSVPPPLRKILDAPKTERRSVQRFFAALGRRLQQQVDIDHRVETLEWQIDDKANIIELLTLQVRQKTEDGERFARNVITARDETVAWLQGELEATRQQAAAQTRAAQATTEELSRQREEARQLQDQIVSARDEVGGVVQGGLEVTRQQAAQTRGAQANRRAAPRARRAPALGRDRRRS